MKSQALWLFMSPSKVISLSPLHLSLLSYFFFHKNTYLSDAYKDLSVVISLETFAYYSS